MCSVCMITVFVYFLGVEGKLGDVFMVIFV